MSQVDCWTDTDSTIRVGNTNHVVVFDLSVVRIAKDQLSALQTVFFHHGYIAVNKSGRQKPFQINSQLKLALFLTL